MLSTPGTYALILEAPARTRIRIGRLGEIDVWPGYYLYVGSAFGSGGVAARVGHHVRPALRPHWHIDYLRPATLPTAVWVCHDTARREHAWATLLEATRGVSRPLSGFGASDCACASHLFYRASPPPFISFRRRIQAGWPDHGPIRHTLLQLYGTAIGG